MKTIWNGISSENPIFVLSLGLCSALAVTTTVENAYLMGFCMLIVLVFSNLIISLIKNLIPDSVRIPVYVLIIGTFVTILEMLLKKYIPSLHQALGIYLPLLVINCVVLSRALVVASNEDVKTSLLDAIGVGLGYAIAIVMIAFIRELLGSNSITIMDNISVFTGIKLVFKNIIPNNNIFPMNLLQTSSGAFITLAFLIALLKKIRGAKKDESN